MDNKCAVCWGPAPSGPTCSEECTKELFGIEEEEE